MTVIRVFFAFTAFVAILTIAIVIIANTADVDSMADPAPRPGERCTCINCGHIHPGPACHWCNCTNLIYPLTSGQEIDSRQTRRSGRAPAEGPVPDSAARLSGPSGSRREPIAHDNQWPALHRAKTAWFPDRSGWDQQ